MIWAAIYIALLAALVVRVGSTEKVIRPVPPPRPGDPLLLLLAQIRGLQMLLVLAPVEVVFAGADPRWRTAGALTFATGVLAYRVGKATLGDALSPFVRPVEGAPLVARGIYRYVRHPMYLGYILVALGAPLTLGARWTLALSLAVVGIVLARLRLEERVLSAELPGYREYAAGTKRLLPFVI